MPQSYIWRRKTQLTNEFCRQRVGKKSEEWHVSIFQNLRTFKKLKTYEVRGTELSFGYEMHFKHDLPHDIGSISYIIDVTGLRIYCLFNADFNHQIDRWCDLKLSLIVFLGLTWRHPYTLTLLHGILDNLADAWPYPIYIESLYTGKSIAQRTSWTRGRGIAGHIN